MKFCPQCGTQLDDAAVTCTNCGAMFAQPQAQPVVMAPVVPAYDHTAEYDAKDVSDNKVIGMLVYLFGLLGVIIAALCSEGSPYAKFHVRQALKFTVCEALLGIIAALLCWTVIVPIAAGICYIALFVVKIICFVNVCSGKAVEPALIRNITFLK